MQDLVSLKMTGQIKIVDKETKEVLLDTHNDVLYGNISSALAHALIGNSESFLAYIAFGNGGAYVNQTGAIAYKPSLGGANSLVKLPNANLYNTIYAKKLSNDSTVSSNYDNNSKSYIPVERLANNYEDIISDVILGYNEPPTSLTGDPSATIQQSSIDNTSFVGTTSTSTTSATFSPDNFVFNEIGLFAGTENLFVGNGTTTVDEVNNFVSTGTNFSTAPGAKSKIMLTHAIFHPTQKSANRSIEIIYTLRISMGVLN
jgi:hypothetical protein